MKPSLTFEQVKQCWIEAYLLNPQQYVSYALANTDTAFLQSLTMTLTRALSAEGDLTETKP